MTVTDYIKEEILVEEYGGNTSDWKRLSKKKHRFEDYFRKFKNKQTGLEVLVYTADEDEYEEGEDLDYMTWECGNQLFGIGYDENGLPEVMCFSSEFFWEKNNSIPDRSCDYMLKFLTGLSVFDTELYEASENMYMLKKSDGFDDVKNILLKNGFVENKKMTDF